MHMGSDFGFNLFFFLVVDFDLAFGLNAPRGFYFFFRAYYDSRSAGCFIDEFAGDVDHSFAFVRLAV